MNTHALGYQPSPIDDNDYKLVGDANSLFGANFGVAAPPKHYENIRHIDFIRDQSITNSCVWQAMLQQHWIAQGVQGTSPRKKLSVLYGYWNTRKRTGFEKADRGCLPREAWKAAAAMGFPEEKMWPFDPGNVNAKPDFDAIAAAIDQRWVKGYYNIYGMQGRKLEVMQAISQGHPVVLGTVIDSAFDKFRGGVHDTLGIPTGFIGRHMMCAVAYDEEGLWVVNSWGENWGSPDPTGKFKGGFFRMSWEWLNWFQVTDLWAVTYAKEFSVCHAFSV